MLRERHVATPVKGQGSCPGTRSRSRLQYKRCNKHKCKPKANGELRCLAQLDVILLLDGSASIGEKGWEATKEAAKQLVQAFDTSANRAQIAVLVFSGPKDWSYYRRCTGATKGQVDLANDCNIKWVSHFTTDAAGIIMALGNQPWPKATTLTSAALATARAELRTGRSSAQSVVIVITDGKPMNPRKTYRAALQLRRQARLMWVPVTKFAPLRQIKAWASRPVADNVLVLPDFKELTSKATLNKLIADSCPIVE